MNDQRIPIPSGLGDGRISRRIQTATIDHVPLRRDFIQPYHQDSVYAEADDGSDALVT